MPSLRDLRAAWTTRPGAYSHAVWALILALDRLPWPWGEEIFTGCFAATALVRPKRLRQSLAWASAQPATGGGRWRLVRSVCAHHGRFLARSAFMGIREPETLRRLVALRGGEHLAAVKGGIILLGFHLGPANSYVVLRAGGHRFTWVGNRGASGGWSRAIKNCFQSDSEALFFAKRSSESWLRRLYRARQILVEGGNVFVSADGAHGGIAFSVPVPGGQAVSRQGWWALRRATGAAVLPVLSHMEGRMQITTIHPALPPMVGDPALDVAACRSALGRLLSDYVRRFPEQCYSLAFPHHELAADRPSATP